MRQPSSSSPPTASGGLAIGSTGCQGLAHGPAAPSICPPRRGFPGCLRPCCAPTPPPAPCGSSERLHPLRVPEPQAFACAGPENEWRNGCATA